ncbi:MAG: Hsp20/alpha crystallin family protein [Gammaproteobacteria bacterium]|nr:Hsp20/alpha crystallin family protein [Gammaproteobacteria bacterium]
MSLMKYQPWSMFDQLHRDINQLFDRRMASDEDVDGLSSFAGAWRPAVDIKENDKAFLVVADIPGVNPADIDVAARNGQLTIKGERRQEKDSEQEGVHRVERSYGSFFRSFALPENVDADAIAAKANNGVLEITLPKTETPSTRKIKIEQ